jgi:RNA-directed DNA polymerase
MPKAGSEVILLSFHALYDKVYRADILSHAHHLVGTNKESTGIDGVTFEDIEANEGIAAFIAELEEALRNKSYKPDAVKRVMIPIKEVLPKIAFPGLRG